MFIDELNKEFQEQKTAVWAKGSIKKLANGVEVWGDAHITSFTGIAITETTEFVHSNMEVRFSAFLSGGAFIESKPIVYRGDNCHKDQGLHEHTQEGISNIEVKTIGDVVSKLFNKKEIESDLSLEKSYKSPKTIISEIGCLIKELK